MEKKEEKKVCRSTSKTTPSTMQVRQKRRKAWLAGRWVPRQPVEWIPT